MQLLNFLPDRQLDRVPTQLLATLQDIIVKIQIESHFCIRHADYKSLELPAEAMDRFGQLPLDLQQKYLSLGLRSFLYGIYYNGSLRQTLAADRDADNYNLHQNLENNTFMGIDTEFCERLHQSNNGKGNFDPGWTVLRQENDGSIVVQKHGLTLHIDRDRHLHPETEITANSMIAIRLPKNRVQNGFYVAVGDLGARSSGNSNTDVAIVRVYFNLSSEGAVAVMPSITQQLNQLSIPFTFKVLYNPPDYQRYDSGVLYFEKTHYETVCSALHSIYTENQSHFKPEVPLFTKLLAPGLAVAEEPDSKLSQRESFGTHRCQIVANGLIAAWQKGDNSPEGRMASILDRFSALGIELNCPYLNPNSEDIYTPLNFSERAASSK